MSLFVKEVRVATCGDVRCRDPIGVWQVLGQGRKGDQASTASCTLPIVFREMETTARRSAVFVLAIFVVVLSRPSQRRWLGLLSGPSNGGVFRDGASGAFEVGGCPANDEGATSTGRIGAEVCRFGTVSVTKVWQRKVQWRLG